MNLEKYDHKCVRIIDSEDKCFEGICEFNDKEYNEHEYGRCEDSLQILNILFYPSYIKHIEELDSLSSTEYKDLEELIVDSDIDFIEDALDMCEKEQIDRLILCIKDHLDEFEDKEKIKEIIDKYYTNK